MSTSAIVDDTCINICITGHILCHMIGYFISLRVIIADVWLISTNIYETTSNIHNLMNLLGK